MIELKQDIPYPSTTAKLKTGCGPLYATLVDNKGELVKVFLQLGKAGGCANAHLSSLSGHVNEELEKGTKKAVVSLSQLTGVTCHEKESCVNIAARYILENLLNRRRHGE
jgi:hypothetical protein